MVLQLGEDAEQRAGAADLIADDPVDQILIFRVWQRLDQPGGHRTLQTEAALRGPVYGARLKHSDDRQRRDRWLRAIGPSGRE